MKRALSLNGKQHTIEILSPPPACRFAFDAGPAVGADIVNPEPGVYSILIDGHSYNAFVETAASGIVVIVDGYRFEMAIHDPRQWSRKAAGQGGEGVQTIASPMPGKVVRVLVSPGDKVEAGQGVMVVEAMKMQNEMRATRSGTVVAVPVEAGATVAAGEVLATIA
jgi:biotin carboxyl carrier protein